MIRTLRHIGIVSRDLEASLHFYRDLLGLRIHQRMEEKGAFIDAILGLQNVAVTTVKLAAAEGVAQVELLAFSSPLPAARGAVTFATVGPTHLAFSVVDIDSLYRRLCVENVEFISSPQTSPTGNARVAFCRAPEGTLVELVQEMKT